jgi:phosphoribulokinase
MIDLQKYTDDYNVVFFDLDDTIFNYSIAHNRAIKYVLNKFQLTSKNYIDAKKEIKRRNLASNHHKKELYFKIICENNNMPLISVYKMYDSYKQCFNENLLVDRSMLNLIKTLKSQRKTIIGITNFYVVPQLKKLIKTNYIDYFDYMVTSEEFEIEKPNKTLFNKAMQLAGNPDVSKVIMFGDSIVDDFSMFNIAYHPYNCSKMLISVSGNTSTEIICDIIKEELNAYVFELKSNNIIKQSLDIRNIYQNTSISTKYTDLDVIVFYGKYALLKEVTGECVKLKIFINDTKKPIDEILEKQLKNANIIVNKNNNRFTVQILSDIDINLSFFSTTNLIFDFKNLLSKIKEARYVNE